MKKLFILITVFVFSLSAYSQVQFYDDSTSVADFPEISFQINDKSNLTQEGCNLNIKNLKLRSTIFITHIKIDNNLSLIESDFADKMNKNSENAFFVNSSEYVDEQKRVFAKYFSFSGDTPSNTYFFITDSDKFYLTGSLFFDSKPNYDSLLPSINHVNKDIRKLIQSFNWN